MFIFLREVSDLLPFMEYELHRQIVNKLKVISTLNNLNSIKNLKHLHKPYPFRILYLPWQILMVIVYRKTGFKGFWCTNINNHKSEKKSPHCTQHEFLDLKCLFIDIFRKKSVFKIYIFLTKAILEKQLRIHNTV